MATKKDISLVKKGMQKDKHPSQLEQQEYVFALNANLSNESGNYVNISNEHSTILSSKFKIGWKVIGFKNDINSNNTYFFLTNPLTNVSEIGYIRNTQNIQNLSDIEIQCPTCDYKNLLSEPLEDTVQVESQTYTTLLADCPDNPCLNFSILNPIKSIEIKTEKDTKSIYFTDNLNPPRYIQLNNLDIYSYEGEEVCGDDTNVVDTCLACEKLRIFKRFDIPNITPDTIVLGGNLLPGTYEFLVAYTDNAGNEISEYYSITNPVTIFDKNNVVDGNGDRTNFAIKLDVSNLDKDYSYYKVVVIQTNLKQETSYHVEGIHSINDNTVLYTTEQDKTRTDLSSILRNNIYVEKWRGLTQSNGYLFGYGITTTKEINLQPVVNLFSPFLRWQTHIAKENLYENGIANSLYKSYHRDEVYPFGIKFLLDGGYSTAVFPLIGRPATFSDRQQLPNNKDVESIQNINNSCVETAITERWQLYNTAEVLGACDLAYNVPTTTTIEEISKTCYVYDVGVAPQGSFTISLDEGEYFTSLYDFIQDNQENCTNYPFCDYLDISNYPQMCTPSFEECSSPELVSQVIEVGEVENEVLTKIERVFPTEYAKLKKPQLCNMYVIDTATALPLTDIEFQRRYMPFDYNPLLDPQYVYAPVFSRQYNFTNEECLYAEDIININDPNITVNSYFNNYKGADTKAELETDKRDANGEFIGKSALWFKGNINNREKFILEVSKQLDPQYDDFISVGTTVKMSIYTTCSATEAVYTEDIDLNTGGQYYITITDTGFDIISSTGGTTSIASSFQNNAFYVVVDVPIIETEPVQADPSNPSPEGIKRWRTAPTDGCYSIVTRDTEYKEVEVTYDSISFRKKIVYKASCQFEIPQVQDCEALPYQFGKFAYTESTEEYPDNKELYDSSELIINTSDIPIAYRQEFESYFVSGTQQGVYSLSSEANLVCKNIRHFKFPDNAISPFMWENKQAPFVDSIIYPLGVTIDETVINSFLDIAVNNALITQETRNKIVGYEIVRGDRTLDKGILAKGILFDLMQYSEAGKEVRYSNYPFNDLGFDKLNLLPGRTSPIPHPYLGTKNDSFTFHSPETDYNKLNLPTMLKVEGYMFGTSKGHFNEVRNHPKWIILGRDAKRLATALAIAEVAAEILIESSQAASNSQFWIVAGLGSSGTSLGLPALIAAGVIAAVGIAEGITSKAGRYRYQWLETFRNLGTPRNFAYYYAAEGKYNYLQTLQQEGNSVRNLQIAENIKQGRLSLTNEVEGSRLELNNLDRESSVLVSFGKDFPIEYPAEYFAYDNSSVDFNTSSRTFLSENNACSSGKSPELTKNIASMYVALKNYLPSQYGTIGSVKWLSTGYKGDLKNPSAGCVAIFGGDAFISRHTLRRKMPLFDTTAMGQADLTPYEYKFYSNIGKEPRFFLDYEIDGNGSNVSGTFFPDFDSSYSLDCLDGERSFYIKQPSKFYLYYHGIPNFLVETSINTNYRTAKAEPWNSFYPEFGDFMEWTQESVVSIKRDNTFFYNNVYSKNVTPSNYRLLPVNYSKESYDKKYDSYNGVMYSLPDNSENSYYDPWMVYRPLDFYEFPTDYGKLLELRGIETSQVLGRFENQTAIFNAVDVLVDGITSEQRNLGSGGIFARRPVTFTETDLGYAGSQTTEMVSCEYGHFFADAKRGQVFALPPGGKGIEEISSVINGKPSGMSNWFKEHLPFKILKTNPNTFTDNAYNGVGLSMGWDSRYKRVFLTKKDYIPKDDCIEYDEELGYVINESKCGESPVVTCPQGYTYNQSTQKCEKTLVSNLCPPGYEYDGGTDSCVKVSSTVIAPCPPFQGDYVGGIFMQPKFRLWNSDNDTPNVSNGAVSILKRDNLGRVYVAGFFTNVELLDNDYLFRLNYDGTVDNSFDIGTGFSDPYLNQVNFPYPYSIDVYSDNKIIVGGSFKKYQGVTVNGLVRLHPNGDIDDTFNMGTGFNSVVLTVRIVENDKLLVTTVDSSATYNGVLVKGIIKLNYDGSIDETFQGGTRMDLYNNSLGNINTIEVQPDGKYLVGGAFNTYNGVTSRAIARLLPNGNIDPSFDIGVGFRPNPEGAEGVLRIKMQGNKIVVMGRFDLFKGQTANDIVRLDLNGNLDPTFNNEKLILGTFGSPSISDIDFGSQGSILIGGNFRAFDGVNTNYVIKTDANGFPIDFVNPEIPRISGNTVIAVLTDPDCETCDPECSQEMAPDGNILCNCYDNIPALECSPGCDKNEQAGTCACVIQVDPTSQDILTPINFPDPNYFEDVSWTIAYSPVYGSWISYYDFKPNYYVSHHNYFQTGINDAGDEFGLWSHLLTNKSFQVFYGKKYPFVVEYPIKGDPVTKKLNNIELWTEARRNHNDYDYAFSPEITFNKANVYNNVVNSGDLNLVPQKNNLAFTKQYPKTNSDNTQDILVSNVDNFKWSFDYMFNRVKTNLNNQPNWFWDINQINKTVNPHAVGFKGKRVLDRMTGNYFISKLTYDKDSRYNLIFKWSIGETQV